MEPCHLVVKEALSHTFFIKMECSQPLFQTGTMPSHAAVMMLYTR